MTCILTHNMYYNAYCSIALSVLLAPAEHSVQPFLRHDAVSGSSPGAESYLARRGTRRLAGDALQWAHGQDFSWN